MKLNRVIAYLVGFIMLLASLVVYLEYIYSLGFPDGFISELGFAERRLAYIFVGISTVLGLYFVYLGVRAASRVIRKRIATAVILYTVLIITVTAIDFYDRATLAGNGGG